MSQVLSEQVTHQLFGVGQVPVVRKRDTVGRIHIEGLGLGRTGRSGCWIAALAKAHITLQPLHMLGLENVFDQTIVFAQIAASAVTGDHSRGVLAAVLKYGEGVVDVLFDFVAGNYPYYSAHWIITSTLFFKII